MNNDETRGASHDDSEPQTDATEPRDDAESATALSGASSTPETGDDIAQHDTGFDLRPAQGAVARGDRFAGVGLPSGVVPMEDDEYSREATENIDLSGMAPDESVLQFELPTNENTEFFGEDAPRPEPSLADFAVGELVSGTAPVELRDALDAQDAIPSDNYDAAGFATPSSEYSPVTEAQSAPAPVPITEPSRDVELDVFAHLTELRARVLRCVAAVVVAMIVTWQFRDAILEGFSRPMRAALKKNGGILTTTSPTEGFTIYLQITFISAILLVMPVLLYQIWAFVEPALTRQERRYGGLLVPFSVLLFASGSALGFWMSPLFFEFFLQFQPPQTGSFWTFADTAIFLAKMLLAFGITFQVPVVTIFLNKIGLVSRNWLIEYWRHVVIVIFMLVAVVTPTWDPLSLCAAAVPPCLLYGVSIWLVKWL